MNACLYILRCAKGSFYVGTTRDGLTIGWISAVRSSRQPLRGFLRMRSFVNAINDFLMLRSARRARLEAPTLFVRHGTRR